MANYWFIRSENFMQDQVERDGFVSIGFGGEAIGDLRPLSLDDVRKQVKKRSPEATPTKVGSDASQLYQFANSIHVGDWVVTNMDDRQYLIGKVASDYKYVAPAPHNHTHRLLVEWHPHRVGSTDLAPFIRKVLDRRRTRAVNEIARE